QPTHGEPHHHGARSGAGRCPDERHDRGGTCRRLGDWFDAAADRWLHLCQQSRFLSRSMEQRNRAPPGLQPVLPAGSGQPLAMAHDAEHSLNPLLISSALRATLSLLCFMTAMRRRGLDRAATQRVGGVGAVVLRHLSERILTGLNWKADSEVQVMLDKL